MSNRGKCLDPNRTDNILISTLHSFVENLSLNERKEFYRLIKSPRIYVDHVHPRYEFKVDKKAFLGKFHQYFIQKVISNCKNEDWWPKRISRYATIFPFEVCKDVEGSELEIFRVLSAEFEDHVQKFLKNHFDKVDDVRSIMRVFLQNIHNFRKADVQVRPRGGELSEEICARQLENLLHDMTMSSSTPQTKSIPKLTKKGVERYTYLYTVAEQAMKSLSPSQAEEIPFDKYDESYFLNLPESNLNDLYNLLDSNFFQSNPEEYKGLFEKYIFFFLHALRSEQPNPVFFIEDLLYICLKSIRTVETSRDSPIKLKNHISNLVCVYQRKRQIKNDNSFTVSDKSLEDIEEFVKTGIQKIDTAVLRYSTEGALLVDNEVFAATDEEAFDVCFSQNIRNRCFNFISLIIAAAFSSKNFRTLCIYNVYLGTKAWMYNPTCKEKILQFVREYSRPYVNDVIDFSPEQFLIKNFKECFEV